MDWKRFAMTVLAAGVGSSLADWFFMGFLFHEKYKATPEVWRRPEGGAGETRAIAWATALGVLSCAVFVYLCWYFDLLGYARSLRLAVAVWLVAPLPIILTNALWMKYHPLLVVTHSLGWLARLVVTALAVGWLLR